MHCSGIPGSRETFFFAGELNRGGRGGQSPSPPGSIRQAQSFHGSQKPPALGLMRKTGKYLSAMRHKENPT
jgi:hypothetical protein